MDTSDETAQIIDDVFPNEVLEKIIDSIEDPVTILNCRLVNRRWFQCSAIALKRNHAPINFGTGFRGQRWQQNFERFYAGTEEIPFSKFVIHSLLESTMFFIRYGLSIQQLSATLNLRYKDYLVGGIQLLLRLSNLKSLTLTLTGQPYDRIAQKAVKWLSEENLPSLKFLQLIFSKNFFVVTHSTVTLPEKENVLLILRALRNATPKLLQVGFQPLQNIGIEDLEEIFNIFKPVKPFLVKNCTLNISDLKVCEFMAKEQVKFGEMHLRMIEDCHLGTLAVQPNTFIEKFSKWLTFQSESLLELNLEIKTDRNFCFQLPKLQRLRKLEISFSTTKTCQLRGKPFESLKPDQFPCLRSVNLRNYKEEWNLFGNGQFGEVQNLHMDFLTKGYNNPPVRWDKILPNLLCLQFSKSKPEVLKNFFEYPMKSVQHLVLKFKTRDCSNIENIILGTPNSSISLANFSGLKTLETDSDEAGEAVEDLSNAEKFHEISSFNVVNDIYRFTFQG